MLEERYARKLGGVGRMAGRAAWRLARAAGVKAVAGLAAWLGVPVGAVVGALAVVLIGVLALVGSAAEEARSDPRWREVCAAAAAACNPPAVSAYPEETERAHYVFWELVYVAGIFRESGLGAAAPAAEIAAMLAPRFTYVDSSVDTEWYVWDEAAGAYVIVSHSDPVRLTVLADTWRGLFSYTYRREIHAGEGMVVTRDVLAGSVYTPSHRRLQEAAGLDPADEEGLELLLRCLAAVEAGSVDFGGVVD